MLHLPNKSMPRHYFANVWTVGPWLLFYEWSLSADLAHCWVTIAFVNYTNLLIKYSYGVIIIYYYHDVAIENLAYGPIRQTVKYSTWMIIVFLNLADNKLYLNLKNTLLGGVHWPHLTLASYGDRVWRTVLYNQVQLSSFPSRNVLELL